MVGALAAGCTTPTTQRFTGIVTAVEGSGPADVTSVTVRASDGVSVTFVVRRLDLSNGLPAAHLREHLATGAPIVVEYVMENNEYVALRYNDAP